MKRILALLCVIACLCAVCCVPVMAADTYKIHVIVPEGWETAYVWAWNDDQQNAFSAWPGQQLTEDSDGSFTGEVPVGYNNLVIAEKDGGAQTVDITGVEPMEQWIVLGAAGGDGKLLADLYETKPDDVTPPEAAPSEPVALNSLALVGEGIPGLQTWVVEDPAGDMTLAEENVYTKVIAVTAGTAMNFKIAGNDSWDAAYNFGGAEEGIAISLGDTLELASGAESKNLALTVDEDCNLKFTVDLSGDTATLLVEKTDEEADNAGATTTPSGDTITVYAKVPSSWADVRVWAWDDAQVNATTEAWPGDIIMTQGADGWWSVELPVGYNNLLINANSGASQTADLVIEAGKDVWIDALTDSYNAVVYYEKVEITEPAPTEPAETQPATKATTPAATDTEEKEESSKDNTVLFCIIGSVVIIAIAAVVFIVLKKKQEN